MWQRSRLQNYQRRLKLPKVDIERAPEEKPYQNVNTGSDGYEVPQNLNLMEESPASAVAYYSVIPDVVSPYDNITGDEIRPRHWDTTEYTAPDDPYTEIA